MKDRSFAGKHVLVTGSSRGIGWAIAHAFLLRGAEVTINGRNRSALEAGIQRMAASAPADAMRRLHSAAFNVADSHEVARECESLLADRAVDVLVNNAGIQHREPLISTAPAAWQSVLDTNLTAAFLVAQQVAPAMIERGRGKIVNVCSVQSSIVRPTTAAYAAAKGGLAILTKSMCAEWAHHGIQVNGLAPGYIATEMNAALTEDETFSEWISARTPAGRWGSTQDLIGPTTWLCSPDADFVNGHILVVDGGLSAVI